MGEEEKKPELEKYCAPCVIYCQQEVEKVVAEGKETGYGAGKRISMEVARLFRVLVPPHTIEDKVSEQRRLRGLPIPPSKFITKKVLNGRTRNPEDKSTPPNSPKIPETPQGQGGGRPAKITEYVSPEFGKRERDLMGVMDPPLSKGEVAVVGGEPSIAFRVSASNWAVLSRPEKIKFLLHLGEWGIGFSVNVEKFNGREEIEQLEAHRENEPETNVNYRII